MGLFDALTPALLSFDNLLEPYSNAFIRLSFWALISALVSSFVFKKLSNPKKISQLKTTLKTMQNQLNQHDGEFSELKELAIGTIKLSIKRMVMTFVPALLASLPMLFILTFLSNHYELQQPQLNDSIHLNIEWEQHNGQQLAQIQNNTVINSDASETVNWPALNNPIDLTNTANNTSIMTFPFTISTIIHKKQWWNSLIGNPAGYLMDDSDINSIGFDFKQQQIIKFGPPWARSWLFIYFFMTFAFSIVFLFLFKIKF
jgi:hypothetical protein